MAHQWQVGDLAVCVDDSPPKYIDGIIEVRRQYVEALKKGHIYRVTHVVSCMTRPEMMCLGFQAERAGGLADRFRPILPAKPAFIEAMRSLKPKVPA